MESERLEPLDPGIMGGGIGISRHAVGIVVIGSNAAGGKRQLSLVATA
jgi:hypothetical protein